MEIITPALDLEKEKKAAESLLQNIVKGSKNIERADVGVQQEVKLSQKETSLKKMKLQRLSPEEKLQQYLASIGKQ